MIIIHKILQVIDIKKAYSWGQGIDRDVLKEITFDLVKGESLALVGESGCGKSTLGKVVLGLVKPDRGKILWQGQDLSAMDNKEMKKFRKSVQYIPQDPSAALSPRRTMEDSLLEPFEIHKLHQGSTRKKIIKELLDQVGLSEQILPRFPHELSGGQRQRVVIARALTLEPQIMICDEPFSALDVSLQAQLVLLLEELQRTKDRTYILISHDIAIVRYLCPKLGVMEEGRLIEMGPTTELIKNPQNTYTKALMAAHLRLAP